MIWLTWRQHRGELFGAAAVLIVLGALVLAHGIPMHHRYDQDGIAACQVMEPPAYVGPAVAGADGVDERCARALESFRASYEALPLQVAAWLPFFPAVVGIMVGAPLLGREFEQGTWQLAWTQGVTKRQWVRRRFALVFAGVLLVSLAVAAIVSWWFEPLAPHAFTPEKFNHGLLVFPAYVLFACALGAVNGTLIRRTIPAAAVTLASFLAVRVPVEFAARAHYRTPLTTTDPGQAQGWMVSDGYTGLANRVVPTDVVITYHPADRFWQFQLIEASIFIGLAAILVLVTYRVLVGTRTTPQRSAAQLPHPALTASP
jgi:hypothetical protein